jgi:hypothetical protein
MTQKDDKGLELVETPQGLMVYTPSRRAYLLTLYTPPGGQGVVLLQASHEATSLQFPDLESATSYIAKTSRFQLNKEEP